MPVVLADVVDTPLDVQAHLDAVEDPKQGAISTFIGQVRDHDPQVDGEVVRLSYSHHPDAPAVIRRIAEDVATEHDPADEALVAVTHRVGELSVGDLAVVVAVSAPHRGTAITICSELIERIKHELPIWKKQHDAEGGSSWSGLA